MRRVNTNPIQSRFFHALCARALLQEVKLANADYQTAEFRSAKSHYTNARSLMVLENIEDTIGLQEKVKTSPYHTVADPEPNPLARCKKSLIEGCSNHALIDFEYINALATQYPYCNNKNKLPHQGQQKLFGLLDQIIGIALNHQTTINTEALLLLARKTELGAKCGYIQAIATTGANKQEDAISYNLVHKQRDSNRKTFFTNKKQENQFNDFINDTLYALWPQHSIQTDRTDLNLSSVLTENNREILELIAQASMDYRSELYMFFYPHQLNLLFGPLDYQGSTIISQIRDFCAQTATKQETPRGELITQ